MTGTILLVVFTISSSPFQIIYPDIQAKIIPINIGGKDVYSCIDFVMVFA